MSKVMLKLAVDLAGGQTALAAQVKALMPPGNKLGQEHIWKWLNKVEKSEVPPAEYVLPIAQALNWQVTPHQLRADLYPNPDDGLPFDKRNTSGGLATPPEVTG